MAREQDNKFRRKETIRNDKQLGYATLMKTKSEKALGWFKKEPFQMKAQKNK